MRIIKASVPNYIVWISCISALAVGLLITTVIWFYSQQQQSEHLNKEFTFATEQIASNVRSRIDGYEIAMRGVKGYFQGSQEVTNGEFKQYVKDLRIDKKQSGIQGIGLVELVPNLEKSQHEVHLRTQLNNYKIWPASDHAFYAPIVRMEPMDEANRKALGFDVFTHPAARLAMEKSRDLDIITITSPIKLVQDAGNSDSLAFVMYLPIYAKKALNNVVDRRAAIRSWVDVPFRINDLMTGLSAELPTDIMLEIYDGEALTPQARLYQSTQFNQSNASHNLLTLTKRLEIGSRTWTLLTKITPAFEKRVSSPDQSAVIALTGVILSVLLAWITWLLVNSRQQAKTRYLQLFSQAGEGVLIFDKNHRIVDCNRSAEQMFGYSRFELLNLYLTGLLAKFEINRLNDFYSDIDATASTLKEWPCVGKNQLQFTAEVSSSRLDDDNHYFVILRDLTERKKAEQRILRLSNFYLALSETNQAIVRMDNENELFQMVCKCAVDLADMKLAWIGQKDEASSKVYPAAIYTTESNVLKKLETLDYGEHFNNGPPTEAMRLNHPVIINDTNSQSADSSWNVNTKQLGWNSAGSFPINRNGQAFGVLTVYHDAVDAFDQEAIDLFAEISGDISFALDNFDRETKRIQSEKLLLENEQKLSLILENVAAYIYLKDVNGRYLFANQQLLKLLDANLEDVVGFSDEKFFDAQTSNNIQENELKVLINGETLEQEEVKKLGQSGEVKTYWSVKIPLRNADGTIYGLCGISTDITQQKIAEADLRVAAIAFESQVGMMITDANRVALKVNNAYMKILGYRADEVVGHVPKLTSSDHHDAELSKRVWSEITNEGGWDGEVWNRRKNGEVFQQRLIITAVKDANSTITHYVVSLTDVTEAKAAAMEIEHLAFYDTLTQLPNRRLLLDRLKHALAASYRSELVGALLYLDIDHFKVINDSRGHDTGDLLLKLVAERLNACVRAEDTVARLGGDEYVIMLEGISKEPIEAAAQAELVAQKIQTAMSKPCQLDKHHFNISASIGLVLFNSQIQSPEELLKQADIAMYHVKKSGRSAFRFFDPIMQSTIDARVLLEEELRNALALNQFHLYYQPQVDITGKIIGAEALIRWEHPERGLISPFHFIPLAEETGLILPIGQWVLNQACTQLKLWQANPSTQQLSVSINVSAKQFHQADFVELVVKTVELNQIKPGLLKIELTESMLVDNIETIISSMNVLKKAGVSFELDDFGTGYSSLQYLKRLPLHQLKIDQSFVREIATDKNDKAIVKTIINMAQGLGLQVIAEGVETREQLQHLQKIGCAYYQGYYFGKPVPIEEFTFTT